MTTENTSKKVSNILRKARLRIGIPGLGYEIAFEDLLPSSSAATVDERIAKLGQVKRDLEAAIAAVSSLQAEATERKIEADTLQKSVSQLEQDKQTAESLLRVPEESFSRLLGRVSAKGRIRGLVEGGILGLITGVLSSLGVWYFTKP